MKYFDWAATAIPKRKIIEDCLNISLNLYGNPSSTHDIGSLAKDKLNQCREECAGMLGCSSDNIYFTSGGSESNNIALLSFLRKHQTGEIITTSIEHPSGMEPLLTLNNFGWKLKNINPGTDGLIPTRKIVKAITKQTKIISIIYVHNETGIIQPLEAIIKSIRDKEAETEKKIHIHVDGVQALGKININLTHLDVDSFSASGHKFGAPKGVGLLYFKSKRDTIYRGGGQESGIRPGTENLFGIMAMTECLKESIASLETLKIELNRLMDDLITGVRALGLSTIPKSRLLSDPLYVPNILSLTCPPLPGEVIARVLNSRGFMVSTGSACSSNKKSTTKGILSMGISAEEGFSSFRVSIGHTTTKEEIELFLVTLKDVINELNPS